MVGFSFSVTGMGFFVIPVLPGLKVTPMKNSRTGREKEGFTTTIILFPKLAWAGKQNTVLP